MLVINETCDRFCGLAFAAFHYVQFLNAQFLSVRFLNVLNALFCVTSRGLQWITGFLARSYAYPITATTDAWS